MLKALKTTLQEHRALLSVVFVFFLSAAWAFLSFSRPSQSSAVSNADFRAGNIITDAVMSNYDSMSVEEIQAFLTAKNPCSNTNYALYVDQSTRYPNISWHWSGDGSNGHFVCLSEEKFGDGTEIGEGSTAAEIIYQAAQEYRINPQVLIVLLEKEQSLITDSYPHSNQYRSATGYGCPDTAACDSRYYGFKNQVFRAAELFRYTLDNGSKAYPENQPGVFVAYNPSPSCGGTEVLIENRATAALYRYTPYQPNAAALAAGSGMGDYCSAYGNRNFFRYFSNWFGSTRAEIKGSVITLPEGLYGFRQKDSSSGLAILANSNLGLGTNIQSWRIERVAGTDLYTFTDPQSGYRVSQTDSGTLTLRAPSNTCSERWRFYGATDGYLMIESSCGTLNVIGAEGQSVLVGSAVSNNQQKWSIYTGDVLTPEQMVTIVPHNNSGQAVDVLYGRNANGTNIQLYQANGQKSETWQFVYQAAADAYQIINPFYDRALDLADAATVKNANIQLYAKNTSCAQLWRVIPSVNQDSYTFLSACRVGWAIDLPDGETVDMTNVRLWPSNNSNAQRWHIESTQNIPEGTYVLTAKNNPNRAMDVADGRNANGTNIHLWDVNGAPAQEWRLEYIANASSYRLVNPATDRALDLADAATVKNANIQLYAKNTSCAQLWKFLPNNDGYYTLASTCDPDYAIDLPDGISDRRTNVRLWLTNKSNAQRWHLVRQETTDIEESSAELDQNTTGIDSESALRPDVTDDAPDETL